MNIKEYLESLFQQSESIFTESTKDLEVFGIAHHGASCVFEYANALEQSGSRPMLFNVCSQLESSTYSMALGLYRQAFSSLRLALEFGLGTLQFSLNTLEEKEWEIGKTDIRWAQIVDSNNGILSKRLATAFFPELEEFVDDYRIKAEVTYRALSEYVHGNYATWSNSHPKLQFNKDLFDQFFNHHKAVGEILLFTISCRYLKSMSPEQQDSVDFIKTELAHIDPIRKLFGR